MELVEAPQAGARRHSSSWLGMNASSGMAAGGARLLAGAAARIQARLADADDVQLASWKWMTLPPPAASEATPR